MKIVFLGEDSFSATVVESLVSDGHQILAVFCPVYDNQIYARLKRTCENNNIPFHRIKEINSSEVESLIRKLNPELISVCHFQQVLKQNIIKIPSRGCINLHPSLLPLYRGLSPQHWPIINGDKETGITVHVINEGIDSGDIILQHKIPIEPDMYVADLQLKMLRVYKYIVKDAISLLIKKDFKLTPQDPQEGSYYGRLKEKHCLIDLNKRCIDAYNLVRGVSKPYMGARISDYRIWEASIASEELNQRIQSDFKDNDIYFDSRYGAFIKFGTLLINKYDKINE